MSKESQKNYILRDKKEKEKNEREKKMEELKRLLYYFDGDSNKDEDRKPPCNHRGFIGEAYQSVIDLCMNDPDKAGVIARKNIESLSSGNRLDFDYEDADNDNFYTVKYTYAYAQHFNHIYRKLLQEIKREKKDKNELTIVSIGAGNFVDYWSLESALYMEKWDEETVSKIHYRAYEYNDWGISMKDQILNREPDSPFRINVKPDDLKIGKDNGNFFNIQNEPENDVKADVVVFPSSFNELIDQQEENRKELKNNKNIPPKNILECLKNMNPEYIIVTGHISEDENNKNEQEIKKILEILKQDKDLGIKIMFDKYPDDIYLQSYRNLLKEIKKDDHMKDKDELKIASISSEKCPDYGGLEYALYMEEWDEKTISKIHYCAYEYMKEPKEIKEYIEDERRSNDYRIPDKNIDYRNFIKIKDETDEERVETNVVVIPGLFNELFNKLFNQQEKEREKNNFYACLDKMNPRYIITRDTKIDKKFKDNRKMLYYDGSLLPSVMPRWNKKNSFINDKGGVLGLEDIERIGRYNPVTDFPERVQHFSYKII